MHQSPVGRDVTLDDAAFTDAQLRAFDVAFDGAVDLDFAVAAEIAVDLDVGADDGGRLGPFATAFLDSIL